jgi:hypothetical protein
MARNSSRNEKVGAVMVMSNPPLSWLLGTSVLKRLVLTLAY